MLVIGHGLSKMQFIQRIISSWLIEDGEGMYNTLLLTLVSIDKKDRGINTINLMFVIHAARTTRSGKVRQLDQANITLINCTRLDAATFKPTKDQRQVINRFRKYILGEDYVRKAARLCPRTREYV